MSNRTIEPSIKIGSDLRAVAIEGEDLMVQAESGSPVALGSFLAHTGGGEGWELEVPTIRHLLGQAIIIENKNRFPDAKWQDIAPRIGTVGEESLYLLGSDGDDEPLVSKISLSDDEEETPSFFAMTLAELLNHSSEVVSIPEPLPI